MFAILLMCSNINIVLFLNLYKKRRKIRGETSSPDNENTNNKKMSIA